MESSLGGLTVDSRPSSVGASLCPCPPSTFTSPRSPLTASTAPSAICRCVFTTSKGRVRVAATWLGEEREQLYSQERLRHHKGS